MAGLVEILRRIFGFHSAKAGPKIADIYRQMRQRALTLTPEQLNLPKSSKVLAVLMETGYPNANVTLVAAADGAASLYFSNGGGIIGAGEHDGPRSAGAKLLSTAESHLSQLTKSTDTPLPKSGDTTFYVITPQGTFSGTAKEQDLGEGRSRLSNLFMAGQNLITQIRVIDEAREKRSDNN